MTYECDVDARNNPPYTIESVMTDEGLRFLERIVSSPSMQKSVAIAWGRPDYVPWVYRRDKANVSGE